MDQALVQALWARGVDITTALEEGMIAKNAHLHLDYAARYGRALYTFYRGDFFRLHTQYLTQSKSHACIILSRQQNYSVGEQMRRLLKLIATKYAEEMQNQVEFLSAWS